MVGLGYFGRQLFPLLVQVIWKAAVSFNPQILECFPSLKTYDKSRNADMAPHVSLSDRFYVHLARTKTKTRLFLICNL